MPPPTPSSLGAPPGKHRDPTHTYCTNRAAASRGILVQEVILERLAALASHAPRRSAHAVVAFDNSVAMEKALRGQQGSSGV